MIDVLIVGAGVSGLTAAVRCHEAGLQVAVVEAMDRIGGRVKSAMHEGSPIGDLGPSWVWPPWQSLSKCWFAELGIDTFPQYEEGLGLLDFPGQLEKHPLPGQHGVARVAGGPRSIVVKLAERLGGQAVQCGTFVHKLEQRADHIAVHVDSATAGPEIAERGVNNGIVEARCVILAIPMRVALESVRFEPELPPDVRRQMSQTPTWMAAQVKVVAHYEEAFWREQGLSGRVASRVGPLVEIHDHCGVKGDPVALFGFMGLTLAQRQEHSEELSTLITEQLRRCFGGQAATPVKVWIEDWARASTVCSAADRMGQTQHPEVRPDSLRQSFMGGCLHFAGAEVASESPGLIDGALHAGEASSKEVIKSLRVHR